MVTSPTDAILNWAKHQNRHRKTTRTVLVDSLSGQHELIHTGVLTTLVNIFLATVVSVTLLLLLGEHLPLNFL